MIILRHLRVCKKILLNPKYFFDYVLHPLLSLNIVNSKRYEVSGSKNLEVWLKSNLEELSIAWYESANTYLLEVKNLPDLFYLLKSFCKRINVLIYISGNNSNPIDVRKLSLIKLLLKFYNTKCLHIWLKTDSSSSSFSIEFIRKSNNGFLNRSENVYLKRIPHIDLLPQDKNLDPLKLQTDFCCNSEIDIVFTWVNGADTEWRKLLTSFRDEKDIDWDRYVESDELKYSMRSVIFNAPWFRKIFIVSNCKKPKWLIESERVVWVDHKEIIPQKYLPTFNSHVIESFLWEIPELSENFIYLNDDFFINKRVSPEKFFTPNGCSISYLEPYGSIGTLNNTQFDDSNPWQAAAHNGAKLIESKFGKKPVQIHRHSPCSLNKTTARQMVKDFPEAFEVVRCNRFRHHTDISPTSFLYHHYSYHLRQSVRMECTSLLIQNRNFNSLSNKAFTPDYADFICLNDGGQSFSDHAFQKFKSDFMKKKFPLASFAEKY